MFLLALARPLDVFSEGDVLDASQSDGQPVDVKAAVAASAVPAAVGAPRSASAGQPGGA
jgi:hypothetical protein